MQDRVSVNHRRLTVAVAMLAVLVLYLIGSHMAQHPTMDDGPVLAACLVLVVAVPLVVSRLPRAATRVPVWRKQVTATPAGCFADPAPRGARASPVWLQRFLH